MKKKVKKRKPVKFNLKTIVKGALRRAFVRSPQCIECRNNAKHPTIKGPRGGAQYVCAICDETFGASNVQVDHIKPAIPVNSSLEEMSWDEIIYNIFCNIKNLQLVCKECHLMKTAEERKERAKFKKLKKNMEVIKK